MSALHAAGPTDRPGAVPVAREKPEVDLVVLVNGFPRLSETFVLQELLYLERLGLRLHVVALAQPEEPVRQSALERLRASVEYLPLLNEPSSAPGAIVAERKRLARRAHTRLALRRRGAYLAGLASVRRSCDYSPKGLHRAAILACRLLALDSPPLYIHFAHKPATIGRFAARLAGVPYALSCHAKDIWLTPPEELTPKLRDAKVALVCTAHGRAELERLAFGTPVRLVHHGVDAAVSAQRRAVNTSPRILTVGRLVEKKGHDTLIRAAWLLRERGVPFTLRIAGDGVEWPRLQRLVHELELVGRVFFLGPLSAEEVDAEYAASTIFALGCRVMPSGDRDGLPNVVLEAMVRGLPVVATQHSGIAEAVEDGRSGLLVAPDDPAALAGALASVLGDANLAGRLGRGAQARVRDSFDRDHTLPAVGDALVAAGLISLGAPVSAGATASHEAQEAA